MNPELLVLLLVVVTVIGTYIYYRKHGLLKTLHDYREVAFQLMLSAEKNRVGGEVKRLFVTHMLYNILPVKLKALVTVTELERWVQSIYDDFVMDYLDDGQLNNSYKA